MINTSSFSKIDKKKYLVDLKDKQIDTIYNEYSLKRNTLLLENKFNLLIWNGGYS